MAHHGARIAAVHSPPGGLSQERLARLLGTTKQAIFYWESGRRKPPPMLDLALAELDRRLKEQA